MTVAGTGRSVDKRPVGRPSEYKEEYAEQIIQSMAEGYSLTAAAARLGVYRQRIYEWAEKNPELADAVKIAKAKRVLKLEEELLSSTEGPRVTARIFALKNADPEEWRDRIVQEQTGKDGGAIAHRVEWVVVDPKA